MTAPLFYARPARSGSVLSVTPALARWDECGSPGQVHLANFVTDVHSVAAGQIRAVADPLALRLNVGLPATVPLFALHDLDNYLFPFDPESDQTDRTPVRVCLGNQTDR